MKRSKILDSVLQRKLVVLGRWVNDKEDRVTPVMLFTEAKNLKKSVHCTVLLIYLRLLFFSIFNNSQ